MEMKQRERGRETTLIEIVSAHQADFSSYSNWQMEGANLYDVFQKISKGDFEPLPSNMFSAPLRGLVARMLSVDPQKRPELEEVWSITQRVVQSQVCTWIYYVGECPSWDLFTRGRLVMGNTGVVQR